MNEYKYNEIKPRGRVPNRDDVLFFWWIWVYVLK